MQFLAEIPFPRIDPILLDFGAVKVRWYGVTYVMAFAAAYWVLRDLAKRKRWPVAPERVGDVLFWGILGVFLGGRIGYVLFYQIPMGDFAWSRIYRVWEGGMSFHGGLLGVVLAYWIYSIKAKVPRGELFDGLTLATPLGIFFVRMANFINAELYGRVWDGPWAMEFPDYERARGPVAADGTYPVGPEYWQEGGPMVPGARHPSQLYEGIYEGLILFFVCRWLLLKRGWTNGTVAGFFLFSYGFGRFFIEFTRQPDKGLDFPYLDIFTQGQLLCLGMMVLGIITMHMGFKNMRRAKEAEGTEAAAT